MLSFFLLVSSLTKQKPTFQIRWSQSLKFQNATSSCVLHRLLQIDSVLLLGRHFLQAFSGFLKYFCESKQICLPTATSSVPHHTALEDHSLSLFGQCSRMENWLKSAHPTQPNFTCKKTPYFSYIFYFIFYSLFSK